MKNLTLKSMLISISLLFGATSVYATEMKMDCTKDKMGCEKTMEMKSDKMMQSGEMKSDKMMKSEEMKMPSENEMMKKEKM